MKNIVITGAGGYIGRNVVKKLLDLGHHITAIDIETKSIDSRANILQKDLFKENDKQWIQNLGNIDICLHLAWRDGFVHNSALHISDLPYHINFIKQLLNSNVKKIAVLGSMHEIGYHIGIIDENTATNPQSMYGIAKNALRQSLQVLQGMYFFELQWLRAYYIYGDDYNNHSIFTKMLQSKEEGNSVFPLNSGTNQYDFIHIDDLTTEISAALLQDQINGIINCCTGAPIALKDMVQRFIQDNNLDMKLDIGAFPDRPYDSPVVYGDSSKIIKILKDFQRENIGSHPCFDITLKRLEGVTNDTL